MFGNKELLTELNFHCIAKKYNCDDVSIFIDGMGDFEVFAHAPTYFCRVNDFYFWPGKGK